MAKQSGQWDGGGENTYNIRTVWSRYHIMGNWRDRKYHILLAIRKFFLAKLFHFTHISLVLYDGSVKREGHRGCLPDLHGPLNKQVPSSSIEEAINEVDIYIVVTKQSIKKRSVRHTILQYPSRKPRSGNTRQKMAMTVSSTLHIATAYRSSELSNSH